MPTHEEMKGMVGMLLMADRPAPKVEGMAQGYMVTVSEAVGVFLHNINPVEGEVVTGELNLHPRGMFVTDEVGRDTLKVLVGAINKVMHDNNLLFDEIAANMGVACAINVGEADEQEGN